jgi:glycosyltransferase involved in cell wall biosynthesis
MARTSRFERSVVDVSDLIHWQGHLSGIQRVVAEMAYRYEKENAVFCYYEEETRQFYALASFIEHMKQREETRMPSSSSVVIENPTRKEVILQLKRIGRSLAPPVALKVARRIRREAVSINREPEDTREPFLFKQNDTLLVFGGHWDKPHYTAVLGGIKREHGVRIAHVVYDLIPVYDRAHVAEEEHVRFPLYIKSISELSDVVYVISEATKRDYQRFLRENSIQSHPKICKIVLGENFSHKNSVKPKNFKESSYILAVGTFEVRKNYGLLYSTYKRAKELGVSLPKLVIVGRRGWLSGDIYYQMVHDSSVASDIIFMHDVDDHELSWLYENCLFTTYPSFYEGWGLPVAEAAYYGKTCAASSSSSIPEVVGACALYFSPYSVDECLTKLQELLNEKTRVELESKVIKRQPNDWDATFLQVKSAL